MKFYRNKKKWKLCDIGSDDRYNCYLESLLFMVGFGSCIVSVRS